MGMWTNDVMFGGLRLDEQLEKRVPFVLYDAAITVEEVPTSVGNARKSSMIVQRLKVDTDAAHPSRAANEVEGEPFVVNTLASTIAEKVAQASASDFPMVVCWDTIHSEKWDREATVLVPLRKWTQPVPENLPDINSNFSGDVEVGIGDDRVNGGGAVPAIPVRDDFGAEPPY